MTSPLQTQPTGDYTYFGVEKLPSYPDPVKPAAPKVDEAVQTETDKKSIDKLPQNVKNGGMQITPPLSPTSQDDADWMADHLARCEITEGLGSP